MFKEKDFKIDSINFKYCRLYRKHYARNDYYSIKYRRVFPSKLFRITKKMTNADFECRRTGIYLYYYNGSKYRDIYIGKIKWTRIVSSE